MGNSNQLSPEQAIFSPDVVQGLTAQRDFLQQLRKVEGELLKNIATSTHSLACMEFLIKSAWQLFPDTVRPCLLWCDKDLTHWRILNYQDWLGNIVGSVGEVDHPPQSLLTFVASPSRPFGYETELSNRAGWDSWQEFLYECKLNHCAMTSVPDENGDWLTFCLFSQEGQAKQPEQNWCIQQFVESVPNWLSALVARSQTDARLQRHTDEQTGLLQPHAFYNAFDMMLRDARRYFLRLAFITVMVRDKTEPAELKLLSDTLKATLRDNDLLACFGEQEFVMAMRIGQLDDAEVIADKIMKALHSADPNEVSLLAEGVSIGIAFYPEQADQKRLYLASKAAADAVTEKLGFRLEFYGQFVQSLDEAYQG